MKIATFKPGSIVREVASGHPYIVIQRLTAAILVVDAEAKDIPRPIRAITNFEFDRYCDDIDMKLKIKRENGLAQWKYERVQI